jgi:hypothetical protein
MLLALLTAAAATTPQPSEVKTFQDWTVACDNGFGCEAIALLPADVEWSEWLNLSFRRGGAAGDRPVVMLQGIEAAPAALLADGRPLAARFAGGDEGFVVQADPDELVGALRNARALEVRGADGARLGLISLAGASAAMLYMDERQRRIGTVTALVRTGPRPASAVPAPPALPQVRIAAAPTDRPLTIDTATVARLRREFGCEEYDVRGPEEFETEQIETGKTLVLVPCGSGAYNFSSVPVIAQRRGGRVTTMVAPFDSQWGIAAEGRPILVNGGWDPATRRLHEYSKARGLGDCGSRSEYAWDGTRFRLIRQEEMEECRGSLSYVTTWRAEALPR